MTADDYLPIVFLGNPRDRLYVVHQELLRGGVNYNGWRQFGLCLRDASVLDVIDFIRVYLSHCSKIPGWSTFDIPKSYPGK